MSSTEIWSSKRWMLCKIRECKSTLSQTNNKMMSIKYCFTKIDRLLTTKIILTLTLFELNEIKIKICENKIK